MGPTWTTSRNKERGTKPNLHGDEYQLLFTIRRCKLGDVTTFLGTKDYQDHLELRSLEERSEPSTVTKASVKLIMQDGKACTV